jgi:hypothetical protein
MKRFERVGREGLGAMMLELFAEVLVWMMVAIAGWWILGDLWARKNLEQYNRMELEWQRKMMPVGRCSEGDARWVSLSNGREGGFRLCVDGEWKVQP